MYLVPLHPCTVYPLVPHLHSGLPALHAIESPPELLCTPYIQLPLFCLLYRYKHSILHNYKEIHRECCQSLIEYLHDMAPSKARAGHDDSRSEASSTREKQNAGHTTTTTKGRRGAAHGAGNSSSLRDVTTAGSAVAAAAAGASNASNQEANVGVSIHSFTIRHTHGC
jgi:hypothetical protein